MDHNNAFSKTNQLKALAGSAFTKFIENELELLVKIGIIKIFKKSQNFKHPGFNYEKQYLADFVIETLDKKFIIVRSTTSYRQDRIKTSFYDLNGINQYSEFSKDIIASVFVVPDKESDRIKPFKKRIERREQYTPASHIFVLSEFIFFLEGYKYEIERAVKEKLNLAKAKNKGSFYGKRGNLFERELAELLSDVSNLKLLEQEKLDKGHLYALIVNQILADKQIVLTAIMRITATNTVPLLKNGGNPKTDLLLNFELFSGEIFVETISLKNTGQSRVSCHDYASKAFIRVLKCENSRLAQYLSLFQQFPTYQKFSRNLPTEFSETEFVNLLTERQTVFVEWVLRGMHDDENLVKPELQVSNYLLIHNGEKSAFYSMKNYISLILKRSKLKFGVPFSWTYPSKQEGKRIQLKLPIYFDEN